MIQQKKVDFHMHSNASDGLFNPQQLIEIAADAGLAAVGLTDHDTVTGLPEASKTADLMGVELIPGVEISALDEGQEIHILGYYPAHYEQLKNILEDIRQERFRRMDSIVNKLMALGFKVRPEEVLAEAGDAAPGRLHIARFLLKKKYVHTISEAFTQYLGRSRPAYVPRQTMSIDEVMSVLLEVGALPVVAHPGVEVKKSTIEKLISLGLIGIEAYHPDHSKAMVKYYKKLAEENGLHITGGSDFHGESVLQPDYRVQHAISYTYLEKFKELI